MNVRDVDVDKIVIGVRARKDAGDVSNLCQSIEAVGLQNAVVVTAELALVSGLRRLVAYRRLGRDVIPAHVVDNFSDARTMLLAERDENTCRVPFTPAEAVALGKM